MIVRNYIKINLSSAPLENHSIYVIATAVVLIIGLWLTFQNIYITKDIISKKSAAIKVAMELNSKIKSNEIKIKQLQSSINSIKTKEFIERCDYITMIVNKRTFSWTQLFNEFEEILPNSVRMIQVTPNIEKGEIRINLSVAAQNLESFLELLKRLENSKVFKNVIVNRESTKDQELTYDLSMEYQPPENNNIASKKGIENQKGDQSGKN